MVDASGQRIGIDLPVDQRRVVGGATGGAGNVGRRVMVHQGLPRGIRLRQDLADVGKGLRTLHRAKGLSSTVWLEQEGFKRSAKLPWRSATEGTRKLS